MGPASPGREIAEIDPDDDVACAAVRDVHCGGPPPAFRNSTRVSSGVVDLLLPPCWRWRVMDAWLGLVASCWVAVGWQWPQLGSCCAAADLSIQSCRTSQKILLLLPAHGLTAVAYEASKSGRGSKLLVVIFSLYFFVICTKNQQAVLPLFFLKYTTLIENK